MPQFPNKQEEILALANTMISGTGLHPEDFPRISRIDLWQGVVFYCNVKNYCNFKKAALKLATSKKNESLNSLRQIMKNCLKMSEVDCAGCPEKLTEIGWSPRKSPQPVAIPAQPTGFTIAAQDQGAVRFEWTAPAGRISSYIIETRQQDENGIFGKWKIVGCSFKTSIKLTAQRRGIRSEYRVYAINAAGKGQPSNTLAITL